MQQSSMPVHRWRILGTLLLALAFAPGPLAAYSLLTHEQLINLVWDDTVVPLLLSQYPSLTPAQIEQARAYAYGGCVIQDIGYYPFGDEFFSDLTHYVRSGDFVLNLFRNAHNANELAFAIGALSHYVGDSVGHSEATNRAVAVEFPSLAQKYGPNVNYAQSPTAHVRAEFAFDIDEIAHHRMAPVRYYRHVGLQVPVKQLALAYYQTYGLNRSFLRKRTLINVHGYRGAVHNFIPRIAYAVTLLRRRHEPADPQTPELALLQQHIAEASASGHWDSYRRNPGIGTYMLAGLLFVLPKVGPLRLVAVKGPTTDTEADYLHSVEVSIHVLDRTLAAFTPNAAASLANARTTLNQLLPAASPSGRDALLLASNRAHPLPNRDLDTGHVVQPGGYPLTDATYASLLHRIVADPQLPIPPASRATCSPTTRAPTHPSPPAATPRAGPLFKPTS